MVTVTPAAPAHVPAAARVLAEAFRDDPVMATVLGDPAPGRGPAREPRLAHLFGALTRDALRSGVIDLARDEEDGTVLGVAVWHRPAHRAAGLTRAIHDAASALREVRTYLRALGPGGLGRGIAVERALDAARPAEPHWYLSAIGVGSAGRGRGIGSALLTARLARADAAGAPAYLEASSARSAALYERHGFRPTGKVEGFPSASAPVAMWRGGTRERDLVLQG